MRGVIERLGRRGPLWVALDGVAIRSFHTLRAAAVVGGRALPLLGASYPEGELYQSQTTSRAGLLRLLRSLVLAHVAISVLAERGFGRAELVGICLGLPNLHFLLRIKPDADVRHPRYPRPAARRSGAARYPAGAVAGGVPAERSGDGQRGHPLEEGAAGEAGQAVVFAHRLAGQRGVLDSVVRTADGGGGTAPGRQQLAERLGVAPDAVDQGRSVGAPAAGAGLGLLWLLVGLGLRARQQYRPAWWCSTNWEKAGRWQGSAFSIGRAVEERLRERPAAAFAALTAAAVRAAANWG